MTDSNRDPDFYEGGFMTDTASLIARVEPCTCIEKVNKHLAAYNTRLTYSIIGPRVTFIQTDKLDSKKRGKPSLMVASYCPFCGDKYPDDAALKSRSPS